MIPLIVLVSFCLMLTASSGLAGETEKAGLHKNLAPEATITASSEFNGSYSARNVADGVIPEENSGKDAGHAWAVNGGTHGSGAEITCEWTNPVTIGRIVYYARTAFGMEGWKDFQVLLDGADKPVLAGTLKAMHGPQWILLPASANTSKLRLRFTSSYGGSNPGASEIQMFSGAPSDAAPAALNGLLNTLLLLESEAKALKAEILALDADAGGRVEQIEDFRALHLAGKLEACLKTWSEVEEGMGNGTLPSTSALEKLIRDFDALHARTSSFRLSLLGVHKLVGIQRHPINPSHVYTYHQEGFSAGGGLCVLGLDETRVTETQLVAAGTGEIQRCDVSWDGREILFNWRRSSSEPYQVYRIGAAGGDLAQLTKGDAYSYDACWLPDDNIVFVSSSVCQDALCFNSAAGVLFRMDRDGGSVTRISHGYLHDFTPSVLNDGRIIYSRWEYVDKAAIPIQSLWTISPDGTMLQGFYGNRVTAPASFMEARPIPGSSAVLCTLTGHNGPVRGAVGIIDRIYGDNAQRALRNVTPEINATWSLTQSSNGPQGPYETPHPVSRDYYLVSRDGTVWLRNMDGDRQVAVIRPRDGMGFYSMQPLVSRPLPPVLSSGLPAESDGSATLVLQDVYEGLAPHVKRGEVKELCVVQEMAKTPPFENRGAWQFQVTVISCGATYAPKKVWGHVPVEEDGSAYFKVPANVPIYFMAIDAEGRAVQRMRSFTNLQPGEKQGCIGCHEPRSMASSARRPPLALRRPPRELRPPEWGVAGFSYRRHVQPVIDQHCLRCHGGETPSKGIDLSAKKTALFNVSYETLTHKQPDKARPFTNWIPTDNGQEWTIAIIDPKSWGSPKSILADLLLAGHPDASGKPRVSLSDAERRRIFTWIDLNVPFYGSWGPE